MYDEITQYQRIITELENRLIEAMQAIALWWDFADITDDIERISGLVKPLQITREVMSQPDNIDLALFAVGVPELKRRISPHAPSTPPRPNP